MLTLEDLANARPEIASCSWDGKGPRVVARPPWAFEDAADASACDVLVVADSRGLVAAASFVSSEIEPALSIPTLGLAAPRAAVPVRRGVTRVSPHATLSARAPIAVAATGSSIERSVDLAMGAEGSACEEAFARVLDALVETGSLPDADTTGSKVSMFVVTQTSRGAGVVSRKI